MDERAAELLRVPLTDVFAPLYEADLADCHEHMSGLMGGVSLDEVVDHEPFVEWHITPTNPNACPLYLVSTVPGEVTITVGRHEATFEIWSKHDLGEFDRELRAIGQAVVDGRYEEWVRSTEDGFKAFGRFATDPPFEFSSNAIFKPRLSRDKYRHVAYEPYRGS